MKNTTLTIPMIPKNLLDLESRLDALRSRGATEDEITRVIEAAGLTVDEYRVALRDAFDAGDDTHE